jgi:hypothetical protein
MSPTNESSPKQVSYVLAYTAFSTVGAFQGIPRTVFHQQHTTLSNHITNISVVFQSMWR